MTKSKSKSKAFTRSAARTTSKSKPRSRSAHSSRRSRGMEPTVRSPRIESALASDLDAGGFISAKTPSMSRKHFPAAVPCVDG